MHRNTLYNLDVNKTRLEKKERRCSSAHAAASDKHLVIEGKRKVFSVIEGKQKNKKSWCMGVKSFCTVLYYATRYTIV